MHHDTDTLAHWRRALVLERINELCEVTKDREFTHAVKELRDELIVPLTLGKPASSTRRMRCASASSTRSITSHNILLIAFGNCVQARI